MSFESLSLDSRIMAGIQDAGFTEPTPIQEQAIPIVLQGGDVMGLAQTGTGKTAAFTLPILERLTKGPLRKIRALIVAPTRELAEQIHETVVMLGTKTKIRSAAVYGGVGKGAQLKAIQSGTEVIVACPGRLLDYINEGQIDLSHVEVLVLDEADRMCDMGFLPDIRRIINKLPKKRQNLFFSATMPKEIRTLADEFLTKPQTVQIGMIAPAKTVSHALFPIADGQKNRLLFSILKQTETDRVLIFTRTKRRARFLAKRLEGKGYRAIALQGNMAQNRRQQAINGFKSGQYDVLVATDIAARGIDVAEISHVINFDMPDTVDAYTHRIGRTGRAHANGEAYTFSVPKDEPMIRQIERVLKQRIERRELDGFEYNGHPADNPSRAPKEESDGDSRQNGNRQPLRRSNERDRNGRNNSERGRGGRDSGGRNRRRRKSSEQRSNGETPQHRNGAVTQSSNGSTAEKSSSENQNSGGRNSADARKKRRRARPAQKAAPKRSGGDSSGSASEKRDAQPSKKVSQYDALRRKRRKTRKNAKE